jgi:hypothetical protein
MQKPAEKPEPDFAKAFRGSFTGILRWPQLDELWQALRDSDRHYYIYAVGEEPPQQPATFDELDRFVTEIDKLLHDEHQEDYCGIVYADDREDPGFIKIFDPNNLGVVCGFSENPPLPGWIITEIQPVDLESALPHTGSRKRWWQKIFR